MKTMDKKIHIPGRKMQKLQPGQQPVIRLTPEAYDALMEIVNEIIFINEACCFRDYFAIKRFD